MINARTESKERVNWSGVGELWGGGGLLLLREQSPKLFTGEGREVVGMFTVKQHHNKTIMWMLQLFNG